MVHLLVKHFAWAGRTHCWAGQTHRVGFTNPQGGYSAGSRGAGSQLLNDARQGMPTRLCSGSNDSKASSGRFQLSQSIVVATAELAGSHPVDAIGRHHCHRFFDTGELKPFGLDVLLRYNSPNIFLFFDITPDPRSDCQEPISVLPLARASRDGQNDYLCRLFGEFSLRNLWLLAEGPRGPFVAKLTRPTANPVSPAS